jgi:hypothetical protein
MIPGTEGSTSRPQQGGPHVEASTR